MCELTVQAETGVLILQMSGDAADLARERSRAHREAVAAKKAATRTRLAAHADAARAASDLAVNQDEGDGIFGIDTGR